MAEKNDGYITTGERVRSFLGWAFIISLIIHFAISPLFPRFNQHHEQQEVEKISQVKKVQVKPPPTPPPPTPTPPPTPPPNRTPPPTKTQPQQKQLKLNPPKTVNNSASGPANTTKYVPPPKGSEEGAPNQHGTAASAPPVVATQGPPSTPPPAQCKTPFQDATATNAITPEYPEAAKEAGMGQATVLVRVTIGPSGSLVDATVQQSSNNSAMDRAAVQAARQSSYQPAVRNCQPTTGTYIFRAEFDPNS